MKRKNWKRKLFTSTVLALALSMGASASLIDPPEEVDVPIGASYSAVLTLNGEELDTSHLPGAAEDMIPARLVAESDYGFAEWIEDEHQGMFSINKHSIIVDFSDNSIEIDGEKREEAAFLTQGVTFLPASVFESLEGYTVDRHPEMDSKRISITTPNNLPLMKLARRIMEEAEINANMQNTPEELAEYYQIHTENFTEIVAFSPMMVNADTLFIGQLSEGADRTQAKADFEARRAAIQASFEQYLPNALEMAKKGKVVEHGDYLMLVIAPDVDKAVSLFETGVDALDVNSKPAD